MTVPARPVDVRTEVLAVIGSILPGLRPAEIDSSKHLKELGADSVDRVEIIMAVLDACSVSAPLSRFSEVPDIDQLIAVVDELRKDARP
jgi:polyketide biosynthesis acyl carrier protein